MVRDCRASDRLAGLATLLSEIELRDGYCGRHTLRVTEVAGALGRAMELPEASMARLQYGALLHDVGRLSLSDDLLAKRGQLTSEEQRRWRLHPEEGARMAKDLGFPEEWEPVILHHHERYDGGGYPEGLMGDNIPLEARVLHVADVIDALRTPRPCRRSLSPYEITIELEYGEGSDFDPKVLSTLRRLDLRLLLGREVGEQSSGPSVLVPRQKTVLTASDLKAALGWTMPGRRRWFSVRPSTN